MAASDLQRAVATATVLAEAAGAGPVVIEPGLKERDIGGWTGLTREEIVERWPDAFAAFQSGQSGRSGQSGGPAAPDPVTAAGGEEIEALVARAIAALGRIADLADADGEVLVVTHGGVIRALERHLGRLPEPTANLSGLRVEVDTDGRITLGDRVILLDPDDVTVTVPRQL